MTNQLSMLQPSNSSTNEAVQQQQQQVLVDYKNTDYKGFLFVVHNNHGMLLLECTRKAKKGRHFQVPGGHVDEEDFVLAAMSSSTIEEQLQLACKIGAARELFEETGMDLRQRLDRLQPATLRKNDHVKDGKLMNELKQRLFFFLPVTDDDFLSEGLAPINGSAGQSMLRLKISHEHSRFMFEPEPTESLKLLEQHSGGKVSEALLMAMNGSAVPLPPPQVDNMTVKAGAPEFQNRALEIPPKPEKKGLFCCFP